MAIPRRPEKAGTHDRAQTKAGFVTTENAERTEMPGSGRVERRQTGVVRTSTVSIRGALSTMTNSHHSRLAASASNLWANAPFARASLRWRMTLATFFTCFGCTRFTASVHGSGFGDRNPT